MKDYSKIFELMALAVKQEKLMLTIALHDQYKDDKIKEWEVKELARTQIEYIQLKNKIYNGKDKD